MTAVAIAPDHKEWVLLLTFAVGLLVAALFASVTDAWSLFGAALVGGALGALAILLWLKRSRPIGAANSTVAQRIAASRRSA